MFVPLPFEFQKYSFLLSIDEIIFDILSKFGLGAQALSLNGFLLILKESHGGKNVSYVTIAMLLICFWFLNYVNTFTHCPMTAYFLKNLTQLRVYWTTEWKMRLSNWRRLWTRGPWTPTLDWVHKPLSWTGSMHPLSWRGSMDTFFKIMINEQKQK